MVAKKSNQAKSGIGRSRSLRLDSSPVWSRGRDKAYLGDKFALGRFLVRLITALGFIKLGSEPWLNLEVGGQGIVDGGIDSAWWGCVSRPSHNLSGIGRAATSRDTGMTNRDLGASRGSDERLRAGRAR